MELYTAHAPLVAVNAVSGAEAMIMRTPISSSPCLWRPFGLLGPTPGTPIKEPDLGQICDNPGNSMPEQIAVTRNTVAVTNQNVPCPFCQTSCICLGRRGNGRDIVWNIRGPNHPASSRLLRSGGTRRNLKVGTSIYQGVELVTARAKDCAQGKSESIHATRSPVHHIS